MSSFSERVKRSANRASACITLAMLLGGCAGHAARTQAARSALDGGNPKTALALYNDALGVAEAKELPADVSGDNTLLLLDRAVVLQAVRQYELSSRDLEVADKQIELLDFSRSTVDEIGKYVFSDDTGPYKAPLYEKLLINSVNLVNYLVRRDLSGAKVEARRLTVMQKHVKDTAGGEAALATPGSYLSGFAFEKANEPDTALRYYDEALQAGDLESLHEPIRRLATRSSYRTPRIEKILAGGGSPEATGDDAEKPAELLVVINYGRVPAKVAKRLPIGLALTLASRHMSPANRSQANHLAGQGLVTWVNFPDLGTSRVPGTPSFALDGKWQVLEGVVDVDREVRKSWDETKGAIIAAAIVRTVTRVVAGEAIRHGSNDTGFVLASLAAQAVLTVNDTPDTRSWVTLPARIAVARVQIPAGAHSVELSASARKERFSVNVKPGDWAVVNLTVLR